MQKIYPDAKSALDRITWRIARHGQGGRHDSFLIADAKHAWLLETAGRFWAACWIRNGIVTAYSAAGGMRLDTPRTAARRSRTS